MAVDREMLEAIGQVIDAKLNANNQSLRAEMSAMMDAKLEPFKAEMIKRLDKLEVDVSGMKEDVSGLKEDVSEIREDGAVTREATNKILAWAEEASVMVQIPLFKKD